MQSIRRLGVCFFKSKQVRLSDADLYLIDSFRQCLSALYVVYSGNDEAVASGLKGHADHIAVVADDCSPTDGYAYLLKSACSESLSDYNELVLFDNSLFGPFYPLDAVFSDMERRPCDFWGLLQYGERYGLNGALLKKQFNQGFLVVRASLFSRKEFVDFFSLAKSQMTSFLPYFSERGYFAESYIDCTSYQSVTPQNNFDIAHYMVYELIHDRKYPFLDKACFVLSDDDFDFSLGEGLPRALQYISERLDYPIGWIWDYVLKSHGISELYRLLHLHYVLPYESGRHSMNDFAALHRQTVVVIHLYYMDLLDELFSYIAQIPEDIQLVITSEQKNHTQLYEYLHRIGRENVLVLAAGPNGRDVAALLVTAKPYLLRYKYLCFLHDKKTTGKSGTVMVGNSFRYMMWENMLKSSHYIDCVLDTFEQHPRLGLLAPPEPLQGEYFFLQGSRWGGAKKNVEDVLQKLHIDITLEDTNDPFTVSTSFWCRTEALKKLFLFPFRYEDFPQEPVPLDGSLSHGIEKCLLYVAQDAGFFSGIVENTSYAGLHLADYQRMLSRILAITSKKKYFSSFSGMCKAASSDELLDFCRGYHTIYIYGAGTMGKRLLGVLRGNGVEVAGFIVSDGQVLSTGLAVPCYPLSKVHKAADAAIVVAAVKQYRAEMLAQLEKAGWTNFLCYDL